MARYVRYQQGGTVRYGELKGDTIQLLLGDFAKFSPSPEPPVKLQDVKLLSPCSPSKIVAIGPNYKCFFANATPPSQPSCWLQPPTGVNHPEGIIELPPGLDCNHEVELAIVIGRRAKCVKRENARDYIFGYTLMNDVTAGDFQTPGAFPQSDFSDYGKIYDGFAPLGPNIVTGIDVSNLKMETRVNGKVRQSHSTSDHLFTPEFLVEFVTNILTLEPGDVISTGSPPGMYPMRHGDVVEIEIENIGVLRNYCRDRLLSNT
jgi:2-keto-4-pentenoate hydratase/2-oxohepta-3-ene-1,7-dioic acid hydratase in catechol pathway